MESRLSGTRNRITLAVRAVPGEAAVDPAAQPRAVDAEERRAGAAVAAGPAQPARGRVDGDAVAHDESGDARPRLDDLAAHLVAHDHWRMDHVLALQDVDVGAADAGVVDPIILGVDLRVSQRLPAPQVRRG